MNELINLSSSRAYNARLSKKINKNGYQILLLTGSAFVVGALVLGYLLSIRLGLVLLSLALICYIPALWWRRYLSILPPDGSDLTGRLSVDVLALLKTSEPQLSKNMWNSLSVNWQAKFILNHLLLGADLIASQLESADSNEAARALDIARQIADNNRSKTIELGFVITGLMLASPRVNQLLTGFKFQPHDVESVANWLGRTLKEEEIRNDQNFGGIGRDWAFGFTPLLNKLGKNISLSIAKYGSHFGWLTESDGVKSMESAFDNNATAIALIGNVGIGKTNSVYALAQRLIEGKTSSKLAFHQIVSINATDITSNARQSGELEHIMLSLSNEASHAGHIVLFLDDAQLFFNNSPGAFDASQILLSIIQARSVPLILAFTPNEYERLRASNQSLASLLTPVVLQELPEAGVMRVLEDAALNVESKNKVLVAYEALHEAYKLSGRYNQDEAYPGKAIKLLEQSVSHSVNSVVSALSVQGAIEQTRGVKVSSAAPAEANELLNLEAQIHERMVNQSHAVSLVANSLRRARAGVTNPKRPIGSFLFLGPTGVGKTELAKSLAATYFKSENNMIRLDMSEYQNPDDVKRLLSDGSEETQSLILAVRQQPFCVILLDEIEKAHPNILNLLLQLLDEGQLTDNTGRAASFKDSIIIATSNAGAQSIRQKVEKDETIESFKAVLVEELIKDGSFRPELINRFDEVVLFRPLNPGELAQVVGIMMIEINKTLANQNISLSLTPAAVNKIVEVGYDPTFGARPMRRTLQKAVEDNIAQKILKNEVNPGDHVTLDVADLNI
jgi:ATP-dependent Clp protease ATP-binding subunit ClpC